MANFSNTSMDRFSTTPPRNTTASYEGTVGTNPGDFKALDKSVLGDKFTADQGMYDNFTDQAYGQATRVLDPQFDRMRKDFDQRAINQGFSQGTEAYNNAFDQFSRQQNDAYNQAAFGAMQYGNSRLDADRNMSEQQRQFDAGLQEGGRMGDNSLLEQKRAFNMADSTNRYGIDTQASTAAANRIEGGRQFDKSFGLQELLGVEGVSSGYRDDAYRDAVFNAQQDQTQLSNLYNLMGLAQGNQFQPINPNGSFDRSMDAAILSDKQNADLYGAVGQSISDIIGAYRPNTSTE